MDCSRCQHHYSQNGKCMENKNNCLFYLEEPRGKMLRSNFSFTILEDAETPVIKPGSIINIEERRLDCINGNFHTEDAKEFMEYYKITYAE